MLQRYLLFLILGLPLVAEAQFRTPDSLLYRSDLQHLVDLQIQRNGRALLPFLDHPDPLVRARTAFALASVQDPTTRAPLLTRLNDGNPRVRADVAFALGQLADSTVTPSLLALLRNETDTTVRRELLIAMGKTGTVSHLQAMLTSPLPADLEAERALAVGRFALRDIHHPMAVRYLVAHLVSSDPELRRNAAYYFGRTRDTAPWASEADAVRRALDRMAPDDPAAMHLLLGLGRLREADDDERLVHWLRSATDWRTRVSAVRALQPRTRKTAIREALFTALSDSSEHVSLVAAQTLAAAPQLHPEEIQQIYRLLQENTLSWRVQAALLPALVRADYMHVVHAWLDAHADYPWALAQGLYALRRATDMQSFVRLTEALSHPDPRVAFAAIEALSRHWLREQDPEKYFPLFTKALARRDRALTYTAAYLLADSLFRPFGNTDTLIQAYQVLKAPDDIEPMMAILEALGATGDATAVPFLKEIHTTAPHPLLRRAAAEALHRLTGKTVEVPSDPLPPERTVDWTYLRHVGPAPEWILETEKGTVVLQLDTEQAPLTVQTILQLTEEGRYNGVPFHRVVPNFVIQGGDFERGDGFGGPGFMIRSEFTRIPYLRGTVGMASAGKDTEGSQYFITHSMQPHLDGRYTAFGHVLEGMDVVDRIYVGDRVIRATYRQPAPR